MGKGTSGSPSSKANEGGRHALAGYLYQLLGTMGLRVTIHEVPEEEGALASVLTLIRDGTLTPEALGQDALITGGLAQAHTRILVQFKYSGQQPPPKLSAPELVSIVKSFRASHQAALALGAPPTGYLLVTNRGLSDPASGVVEAAKGSKPHPSLDAKHKGRGKHYRDILKAFAWIRVQEDQWVDRLDRYAAELGATTAERKKGRFELVGRLIEQVRNAPGFELADALLRQAFCGCPDARRLTFDDLGAVIHSDLRRFQEMDLQLDDALVRRAVVAEINRRVQERCLVIVHGDGGRGKSVSMLQSLQQIAERLNDPVPAAGYWSNEWPASGLPQIIRRWRNLPADHPLDPNSQITLARVAAARPASRHPVLVVGVDGLDEVRNDCRERVRDAVRVFHDMDRAHRFGSGPAAPTATLIVTCRDPRRFAEDWLGGGSAFPYSDPDLAMISVGDFDDREFAEVARRGLAERPHVLNHLRPLNKSGLNRK